MSVAVTRPERPTFCANQSAIVPLPPPTSSHAAPGSTPRLSRCSTVPSSYCAASESSRRFSSCHDWS